MKRAVLLISLVASLLFAWRAVAQDQPRAAEDSYTVEWYTIDGGGGSIGSGTYALNGTSGQPDAALVSAGSYSLAGGFWRAAPRRYAGEKWSRPAGGFPIGRTDDPANSFWSKIELLAHAARGLMSAGPAQFSLCFAGAG
jgi:hypothetical protein